MTLALNVESLFLVRKYACPFAVFRSVDCDRENTILFLENQPPFWECEELSSHLNCGIGRNPCSTGVQTTAHTITLNWTASTSVVAGYNAYRSAQFGGPYRIAQLNPCRLLLLSAGVTAAVDSGNNESVYSNQVSAQSPTHNSFLMNRRAHRELCQPYQSDKRSNAALACPEHQNNFVVVL